MRIGSWGSSKFSRPMWSGGKGEETSSGARFLLRLPPGEDALSFLPLVPVEGAWLTLKHEGSVLKGVDAEG